MSPASGCSCKATSCFVDTHLPRSHWSSNLYSLSPWQHSHMCTAKSSLSSISHENEGHTLYHRAGHLPISAVLCMPTAMGENTLSSVITIIQLRASTLPTSVHHSTAASILQLRHQILFLNIVMIMIMSVPFWYTHVWQKNNVQKQPYLQ